MSETLLVAMIAYDVLSCILILHRVTLATRIGNDARVQGRSQGGAGRGHGPFQGCDIYNRIYIVEILRVNIYTLNFKYIYSKFYVAQLIKDLI
jgi:hypothetical protein